MGPHSRIRALLLAMVALPALPAAAQEIVVTLQNGAVFQGRIVTEDARFLDLEIPKGRIRLSKRWIEVRRVLLDDGRSVAGIPPAGRGGSEVTTARGAARSFSLGLSSGTIAAQPLGRRFEDYAIGSSAEDIVLGFVALVQEGRGAEALEQLADADGVLQHAFPMHSKGLTLYSRKMAARLLMRWYGRLLSDPQVVAEYRKTKFTVRAIPGPPGLDLVELLLHVGEPEPVRAELGLSRGRIVEVTGGPAPFPLALREVFTRLKAAGDKAWSLVPILEELLTTTSKRPGVDSDATPEAASKKVWTLRPHDKGYSLTLPWTWEPVRDEVASSSVDLLVHSPDPKAAALVLSEVLVQPLDQLKAGWRSNLEKVANNVAILLEEPCDCDGVPGVRLRATAEIEGEPLEFHVVIVVGGGRTYQFLGWNAPGDAAAAEAVQSLFAGLRLGP